jgi:hypothetical protein
MGGIVGEYENDMNAGETIESKENYKNEGYMMKTKTRRPYENR